MLSDRELATRVASSNDTAAFTQLVEQHQLAIRCFLRRLVGGDHSTADDLSQETFLIAYKKLHTWRGTGKLKSWLFSIAYRQFLDHEKNTRGCKSWPRFRRTGLITGRPWRQKYWCKN